jgi:predicted dehydrogenase
MPHPLPPAAAPSAAWPSRRAFIAGATATAVTTLTSPTVMRAQTPRMKVAVAGLVHGHVRGFLTVLLRHERATLVGIAEPDAEVRARYAERHGLDAALLTDDLEALLDRTKPDLVAGFGNTFDHLRVVELCAPRGIHVMVEKPLAVNLDHARRIDALAREHTVHVLTQLETSWYPNTQAAWDLAHERGTLGDLRRIVVMDGHPGPKEIGVQPEFLDWLTDPVRNGGGALMDFGCYGANLLAWLMRDTRPTSISATLQHIKTDPAYARVDDDATIVVTYPQAVGIVQGSWNWPFHRKDLEVYGTEAGFFSVGREEYVLRALKGGPQTHHAGTRQAAPDDGISYGPALDNLIEVLAGTATVPPLASLEVNVRAAEILDAAVRAARAGVRLDWPYA